MVSNFERWQYDLCEFFLLNANKQRSGRRDVTCVASRSLWVKYLSLDSEQILPQFAIYLSLRSLVKEVCPFYFPLFTLKRY